MIKKRYQVLSILLTLGMTMLASCGNEQKMQNSENVQTIESETAPDAGDKQDEGESTAEAPVVQKLLTEYVDEAAYEKATMWNSCDDRALAKVMRKASAGEKVTIACIGGSITQGTISNGTKDSEVPFKKAYADLFFEWWSTNYPDAEFDFINAGIGATDSYLGVHRVKEDVLDYNPDLVLVEFSVNDSNSNTSKTNYDNLVRRILLSENHPAVMLLFMGQTNGANAQEQHVLVGFNYALPMISYANCISQEMESETYKAKELSGDEVHPSALGHAIAGELLWRYLNNVYAQAESMEEPEVFAKKSITTEIYLDSEILDSTKIRPDDLGSFEESSVFAPFPNDWTTESGDCAIKFTVDCSRLGIMFYRTTDGKSGQYEVYVDGELQTSLNGDFTGGWGSYAETKSVFAGESGSHEVEITIAPDSEQEGFSILGLLVAR